MRWWRVRGARSTGLAGTGQRWTRRVAGLGQRWTARRTRPAARLGQRRARRVAEWWARQRRRHDWVDHLARTGARYLDHRGYQQAAAVTYFSILSLVPLLMVGLSIAGYVLAGEPTLLAKLRAEIQEATPPALAPLAGDLVRNVIDHRLAFGIAGVLIAGYSGWNWMNALRDALTGMWRQGRDDQPILRAVASDLVALLGLGAAVAVTFALTALGSALPPPVLRWLGIPAGVSGVLLAIGSVLLALAADWLVLWWVLVKLPRVRVSVRAARLPALAAAIGFELLKRASGSYLAALGRSPTGVTFGSIVGLLVFAYLVARIILLAAAWLATGDQPDTAEVAAAEGAVPNQRKQSQVSRTGANSPLPTGKARAVRS